jgi:UDP-N-acetylglucosamine 2-epimerase
MEPFQTLASHRRENFGPGFDRVMDALSLVASRPDVQMVYRVHRNPDVLGPAHRILSGPGATGELDLPESIASDFEFMACGGLGP